MAFKINGAITLDGAMFKRGLADARNETAAFLKNFALGAVGVYSVEQAFHKAFEAADKFQNASEKLDATAEQLQVISKAADDSGVGFDAMTTALNKFNAVRQNILQGGKGSAAQLAALNRLGVTQEMLKENTAATNLMGPISETARKSNAADIAADLKQVFGKGGQEIFGTLKTDFVELEEQMRRYGAIMSNETVAKLDALGDRFDFLAKVVTANLAPALLQLAMWAVQIAGKTGGKYAGALAFYGAETSNGGFLKGAGTILKDSAIGLIWGATLGLVDLQRKSRQGSIDAAINAQQPYEDFLKNLEKAMDEAARRAKENREQKTDFDSTAAAPKKALRGRNGADTSDALISVGNFLGAGGRDIASLAQQQLEATMRQNEILERIASNTEKSGDGDSGEDDYPD